MKFEMCVVLGNFIMANDISRVDKAAKYAEYKKKINCNLTEIGV